MQFHNLNRLRVGGTRLRPQLAVPLPKTPAGRVYRLSPNEAASPRLFVLGAANARMAITGAARARMKLAPGSEQTVCPYSGVVAADGEFTHPDDRQAALDVIQQAIMADARKAFSDGLKGIARRSKSLTYKPAAQTAKPRLRFRRDDLLRELVCDHCGRDYGVFAIGLFCPDCGAPNLRLHFERERELVNAQVDLAEAQGDGLEELSYRLLGNAHEDVLTAFEATLKTIYLFGIAGRPAGAPAVKPVANDFQNLDRAQKRFEDLAFDPFCGLGAAEVTALRLNIQKRHIIGHNLGVVDAKFAEHAAEAKLGETVALVADDIRRFAAICQSVVDRLDEWLCGAPSPTIGAEVDVSPASPAPATPKQMTLDDLDIELSALAKSIGLWLAQGSVKGLADLRGGSDLQAAFPDATTRELNKAVAELDDQGLVQVTGPGGKVPYFTLTPDLYAVFDPVATGSDPHDDACALARTILEEAKAHNGAFRVNARKLFEAVGWPPRRFNPALSLVIAQVDPHGVSKAVVADFAAASFGVTPACELALERVLKRIDG